MVIVPYRRVMPLLFRFIDYYREWKEMGKNKIYVSSRYYIACVMHVKPNCVKPETFTKRENPCIKTVLLK